MWVWIFSVEKWFSISICTTHCRSVQVCLLRQLFIYLFMFDHAVWQPTGSIYLNMELDPSPLLWAESCPQQPGKSLSQFWELHLLEFVHSLSLYNLLPYNYSEVFLTTFILQISSNFSLYRFPDFSNLNLFLVAFKSAKACNFVVFKCFIFLLSLLLFFVGVIYISYSHLAFKDRETS